MSNDNWLPSGEDFIATAHSELAQGLSTQDLSEIFHVCFAPQSKDDSVFVERVVAELERHRKLSAFHRQLNSRNGRRAARERLQRFDRKLASLVEFLDECPDVEAMTDEAIAGPLGGPEPGEEGSFRALSAREFLNEWRSRHQVLLGGVLADRSALRLTPERAMANAFESLHATLLREHMRDNPALYPVPYIDTRSRRFAFYALRCFNAGVSQTTISDWFKDLPTRKWVANKVLDPG